MQNHAQIFQQLATIVKLNQIQEWETIEQRLQGQISRAIALSHHPAYIVYPQTQDELAEIVTCSHRNRWSILPCGDGSKLHWGGLAPSIDLVISTAHLNRVIDHAVGDLTITAEAGLSYVDLQSILAPHSQHLALDPHYADRATLGGIMSTADAGFLRQRYGGARDMVIGLSFVRSDGQLAKAGGRVVKNVAGYDLMKLLTGSWGTLGIITQLTLRLYPQQKTSKTVLLTGNPRSIETVAAQIFASSLTPTAFSLLLPATTQALGVGLGGDRSQSLTLLARFQSIEVSVTQQTQVLMEWGQQQHLSTQVLGAEDESTFWQQIRHQTPDQAQPSAISQHANHRSWSSQASQAPQASQVPPSNQVTAKTGVLPSHSVTILAQLMTDSPHLQGWIHAGSGLGLLWGKAQDWSKREVEQVRSHCESNGGFLTILEAPMEWKQSIDLWGYRGNALPMMNRIKQQFDPHGCLSPGRFVAGQ